MEPQTDVKAVRRQSSFDPNNNQIADDDSADLEAANEQLVEAINGRLLADNSQPNGKSIDDSKSDASNSGEEEDRDNDSASLISDEDFDALNDDDDDEEDDPQGDSNVVQDKMKRKAEQEPYDVDKALISTFLEHTTSIVRKTCLFVNHIVSPLSPSHPLTTARNATYLLVFSTLQAEARLAARRQARAEAREIRMKELERQQKEQEQNADRVFDMQAEQGIAPRTRYNLSPAVNSVARNNVISRRSSEDSVEEEGRNHRDIRFELKVRGNHKRLYYSR